MADQTPGPLVDLAEVPEWLHTLVGQAARTGPEQFGWPRGHPPRDARPAAVLILIGTGQDGPDLLLLRRADSLNAHPGQVAFPGGTVDATDSGPVDAAIREAEEEVGARPEGIQPVATLPELHLSFSDFRVTPVVAYWSDPAPVMPVDLAETAAVARVPVSALTDPAKRIRIDSGRGRSGPGFLVPGMLVWGFTAALLSGLLDLAGWSRKWNTEDVRTLEDAWRVVAKLPERGQE